MKDVANQFNKIAEKYDSQRKKLIPVFDDFYGIAINSVKIEDPIPNVLEIGTGTGLFTEMFLKKYPNAEMDLVDISENMLDVAKERFQTNTNLNFYLEDITKFEVEEDKQYDAIISSLAIHHLSNPEKEKLYHKIGEWIKPEGIFVNAEMIAGETKYLDKMYQENEKEMTKKAGLDNESEKKAFERMHLDMKVPASTQLKWLEDAGFSHVDCIYKAYSFGVLWAKK
ncbi:class I SAM-dependent methyltransferase [Methanobrevibacter sp. TMH8]|uniref:class I SAM-dependent methyltransferase n=1 Tax=Methanobrevibacter sp. TMH8 TaxID=2848611 RepID=UPI001CCD534F|nr:class I SAM-dependent methyltransferase [Methanobrevibacter sp. TMH8]MBZ9571099.1 class I SAM-dependent methyltransferase [Methanobrevibacter sp. TMH8]